MKINDMLLNQLKLQNKYGTKLDDNNRNGRLVAGSKEYWGKDNKASEILERYQVPKTESNKQGVEAFMKNTEGENSLKLETVEIAASNGVEMTEENLKSIHEAVNSDFELEESIEVLVVSENQTDVALTKADVEKMDLPSALKEEIMKDIDKGMPPLKAIGKALGKALGETFLAKFDGKTSGDIQITIKITIEVIEVRFQQEGEQFDLDKLIEQFKALVDSGKEGQGSLLTTAAEVLAALELLELPRENQDVETSGMLAESDSIEVSSVTDHEDISEEIVEWVTEALGSVEMVAQELMDNINDAPGLKLYVVESVTVKMQEVAESFKIAQKNMLQTMEKALSEEKPLSTNQVKEVLSSVINKLDDVLMKSDVPLYTSMSMEKTLLKMSTNLQEARQLLAKGDIVGAKQVIKAVHGKLQAAIFKPSERKIQGFAQKQSDQFLQDKDQVQLQLQNYKQEGVSARNVLELFRSLGLNHEYEVSEKLAQLRSFDKEMKLDGNLKEVLHKLEQDEKQENKTVETIEKSLNNLNGQQLLNKQGQKNNQQTMFFNIPLVNEQEVKNMKLYVNSRDANNRLDWENCSLYFVVDLKAYGPTGIKVDIKDRGVSITVKNDDEDLKHVIEPLIENLGSVLEEVGLKEKEVHFAPLDNHKKFGRNMLKEQAAKEEVKVQSDAVIESQKGFDFKI